MLYLIVKLIMLFMLLPVLPVKNNMLEKQLNHFTKESMATEIVSKPKHPHFYMNILIFLVTSSQKLPCRL